MVMRVVSEVLVVVVDVNSDTSDDQDGMIKMTSDGDNV